MISDNRTYCPRLWDEIFIDKTGQVYSCCHWKPASIGSIYETPLRELCNNKVIRAFRGESLDGNLACFRGCTLLDKNEIRMEREGSSIDYGELRRIKILFAETCNIHCVMCWQDGRSKESLDYDTLIRNVDLEPFESIEIQGGEPLCIKAAKKFFDYAASKGKKISLLTNGLLVNDEWAERFARHSRFVYFSLNAATKHTRGREPRVEVGNSAAQHPEGPGRQAALRHGPPDRRAYDARGAQHHRGPAVPQPRA